MLKKLQNYFFNRKLEKTAHHATHTVRLIPFSEAKYIGLIVGGSLLGKDPEVLSNIIKKFDNENKNYFLIALCEEKKFSEQMQGIPNMIISKKDLTCGSIPSEKIIQKLKTHKFDMLIDLNQTANKTAFFLESITTSTLRIGKADSDRQPFVDLMIEWRDSDNALQFIENVIYYLSMLTKDI